MREPAVAALHQRLEQRGRDAPAGDGAHDLAAAEHGHGLQLDADAVGIVLQVGVVETHDLARRVFALGQALGECAARSATRPASVPYSRTAGGSAIERAQEGVGLVRLDGDHDRNCTQMRRSATGPLTPRWTGSSPAAS